MTTGFRDEDEPLRRLDPEPHAMDNNRYWPDVTVVHRGGVFDNLADAIAARGTHRMERLMSEEDANRTRLAEPVPLPVLFWGVLKRRGEGRNEPFDDAEIRELAEELALLADNGKPAQVDPQTPGTITGYRKHSQQAVDAVNRTKEFENMLGDWIETVRGSTEFLVDDDLARRAAETLQEGFMLLNRSIFQPESKLKP